MAAKRNPVEKDLSAVFDLPIAKFERLGEIFSNDKVEYLKAQTLREKLSAEIDSDTARSLIRVCAHFASAAKEVDDISFGNITKPIDDKDYNKKENILKDIIKSEIISAISKAALLPYQLDDVFLEMSSVVDVRPIFSKNKSKIVGEIISPMVKITYFSNSDERQKSLVLSVDGEDLDKFVQALQEVVSKIQAITTHYTTPSNELRIVAGESKL